MSYERHQIGDSLLLTGDCRDVLRSLPECFRVDCCVTSPPYYGLRDYGHDGQIGLESTPDDYVARLVEVFREVRRVLADDGTLWLNLGDSYNGYMANQRGTGLETGRQHSRKYIEPGAGLRTIGLKNKDLLGIPWRVAFALQADGWYLRQDIIWAKPNPMPESVKDRCTKAHEYIFLLSKSARYWYDAEAIAERAIGNTPGNVTPNKHAGEPFAETKANLSAIGPVDVRNRRSVWTVATEGYAGAHFATFPPALIEPCILAGCPAGGTVLDPFSGSGTTGQVALQQGRKYLGIELNPEYQALAIERITPHAAQTRLFT